MTKFRRLSKTLWMGEVMVVEKKEVSEWKGEVTDILVGKVEEFQLLDYSKTTPEDVWDCLQNKVWKGNPKKALYEVVQDIYHLSPNIYMTYLTQQSLMADDLRASIDALLGREQKK